MAMKRSPQPSPEPAQHLPLSGFYRLYAANLKAERKSVQTISIYTYVLEKFAAWVEAEFGRAAELGDFTPSTVRLFLGAIQDKTKWQGHPTLADHGTGSVAGATGHLYTRTLKTFAAWLAREEHVPVHPLLNLRLPKVEQKQLQPLSEEEERGLVNAYDDNNPADCRIKAIMLLMLDTGLRRAEGIGLKDANIDLDQGFLLVMGVADHGNWLSRSLDDHEAAVITAVGPCASPQALRP